MLRIKGPKITFRAIKLKYFCFENKISSQVAKLQIETFLRDFQTLTGISGYVGLLEYLGYFQLQRYKESALLVKKKMMMQHRELRRHSGMCWFYYYLLMEFPFLSSTLNDGTSSC